MIKAHPVSHRRVAALAVPLMLANLSTPLVGLVDTAVVGQLPDPVHIGAVAAGSVIFTLLFWAFGFLRMGTTGLTAQATGAGDRSEASAWLLRALLIAAAAGALLIFAQWPLGTAAFRLLDAPLAVEQEARAYFAIRIYAAPATFATYALLGWYVGRGQTTTALTLQLILNLTNVALDALFVLVLHWGVAGVAAGTVVAEYTAAVIGCGLAWRSLRGGGPAISCSEILSPAALKRMVGVNRDIMIRSLALILVFVWFVRAGAQQGPVIFAANAILVHFVSLAAYFLDGFAHTAETLVGQAIGRRAGDEFTAAIRLTTAWAAAVALVLVGVIFLAGPAAIEIMSVDPATRATAHEYLPWVAITPILGVWAFQLDGIFIGATRTPQMRRAMLFSLAGFFVVWWLAQPLANHGLWLALACHYVLRAVSLIYYLPALRRDHG